VKARMENINSCLQALSLEVVVLEEGDIQALGQMLNTICSLIAECEQLGESTLSVVTAAVKDYLERLILSEAEDPAPLEEGVTCLLAIFQALSRQEEFQQDVSPLLEKLGYKAAGNEARKNRKKKRPAKKGSEPASAKAGLNAEDKQVLQDFIAESLDNLAVVEVRLIELEEDPDDLEVVNDIFRTFHTIKGLARFLNFDKIQEISHCAESLLDKAREREIRVDAAIVDIILESVDALKNMIMEVQANLENESFGEGGMDIAPTIAKIEELLGRSEEVRNKPLGEIMVEKGVLNQDTMGKILEAQKRTPGKKLGEVLIEEGVAGSKDVISALRDQRRFGRRDSGSQVKVETKKLDTLVDMTGELVIAHSMLRRNERVLSSTDQGLNKILNQISQITSTLQKTSMSMRMVPIKNTFQKMFRVVRDLARSSGKEVTLRLQGEETEIDRNMVDELYEPMVHMIRNAIDHGIEMPDEREKKGKAPAGRIDLCAYHRGGNIVIEIKDDGKGLDKAAIYQRAVKRNLIDDREDLSDAEIYNLIFRAGFSTAEKVTDVSGRGVGMDVVTKAVEKLKGRVEILSKPDQGAAFIIRLPLTLAIIEGMLCRVGQERYIIPTLSIIESFLPEKKRYFTIKGKGEMVLFREEAIPLIRLDRIFGVRADSTEPGDGLVVAVEHDGVKRGLLFDEILGKEEVVIKSLGESLKETRGIAGGAIMGDGRVGLILDIPGVIEIARDR